MATRVESTKSVITSPRDSRMARGVLKDLSGPSGSLRVEHGGQTADPIPTEIGQILQQILEVMAHGGTVTISATPEELTTSSAAAVLSVSRPTLLKMVADGKIESHRVGTHTRFRADDIFEAQRQRRARERAAFDALRQFEGDEI